MLWLYLRVPRLPSPSFKILLPLLAPAAVAVAAAVPAAVLWPPNRSGCGPRPSTASCVFWCCGSIFGFRDCHLLFQNTAATAGPCCCGRGRCGPCCPSCCGRGRCGPLLWPHCCSAVAAQSFLRVPRLPPAPLKTFDPSLQLPSTASCVFWCCGSIFGFRDCHLLFQNIAATAGPCCCGRGRCGPCCPSCCGRGRCGPLLWPHCCSAVAAQSFLRVPRLPPAPLKTSDPSLQLPSTASCVFWCCGSIFGFRDFHLLFQNIAATAGPCCCGRGRCGPCCPSCCGRGRCGPLLWPHCCSVVAAQSFLRVPRLPPAPLKTSDPSLQLPSTASCVFWCCGSIFGFRDFHLLFQNIAATAGPCCCGRGRCGPCCPSCCGRGRCGPLLWPHCCSAVAAQSFLRVPRLPPAPLKTSDPSLELPSTASCVFWCCGSIFGFRDCHLLFQNIAATAGPCCCGRGRCGPCCPSCCGRGRCGPLLWPHCCSAVAAQSFLRVPRLPPAPLKTSDPSLQLPSTASCVFWCCGSIFGFRDFHLLFQNIAATAGPCCCGRGRCGPCCPSCCGRGRCGPLLWPHCCSAVAAQSFLRVPRLPPAPLKTSDPSLQLPSTASCVFWCCGSIFGFRDFHLLFQNIAATAGPCCCGRGRCGPCCPSCCGRGRCGPLLWPHCCSAVAAQSFLRVPRLPPAPLKTSDPSLQLPSTASCVFWCCGSIFGFRDCHLLFQNIAPTAGPCCCGHGRCGPCCPCCCGRGRCGPLLWPHCCRAVAAQSFLRAAASFHC